MVANFEKFLISSGIILNFRKVTKFQRVSSKALKVMEKEPKGGRGGGLSSLSFAGDISLLALYPSFLQNYG